MHADAHMLANLRSPPKCSAPITRHLGRCPLSIRGPRGAKAQTEALPLTVTRRLPSSAPGGCDVKVGTWGSVGGGDAPGGAHLGPWIFI